MAALAPPSMFADFLRPKAITAAEPWALLKTEPPPQGHLRVTARLHTEGDTPPTISGGVGRGTWYKTPRRVGAADLWLRAG
jgi:hypothetical protein